MQTYKSNKILSEWLNNIVRGRLVYQMSTASESQKRNPAAPNLVKSISIWIWIHTEGPKADFKNVILDPSAVLQMYEFYIINVVECKSL